MKSKKPATASPISFDVQPDFFEVKEKTRLLLCPVIRKQNRTLATMKNKKQLLFRPIARKRSRTTETMKEKIGRINFFLLFRVIFNEQQRYVSWTLPTNTGNIRSSASSC
ncbi:hypothetical protein [Bacteroides pyogenes]|uniref:hypothetical protein n=1 Tax=Bacteroides pyogenes TaxID=310300 RepID=UPI0011E43AFA|nr:hypothetical protein [Bacteroides pyogenes]TYK40744.1 hypothetical protein FNJ59_04975 [Bacteroides pyogenes]